MALATSETPALDAEALLMHILGVERAFLFAHGDLALDHAQQRAYRSLVSRRAAGEPIAYIIGEKGFYDLELRVSPAVLIPRPETELLLEEALRLTESLPGGVVADIGTGSGALALAFARQRRQCQVYATDISAAALDLARFNASRCEAEVTFINGNLARPLIDRRIKVDLLMANLPYIASDELAALPVSRWEPRIALDGGADGLDLISKLIAQLPAVVKPGAHVLLEIGADQGPAVSQLIHSQLGSPATIFNDYAGLNRIAHVIVD